MTDWLQIRRVILVVWLLTAYGVSPLPAQSPLSVLTNREAGENACVPSLTDCDSKLTPADQYKDPSLCNSHSGSYYTQSCCGSPGRRGCATPQILSIDPFCVVPPVGNGLRTDPYVSPFSSAAEFFSTVGCNLPAPSCVPANGTLLNAYSTAGGPLNIPFYVTSDTHPFRFGFTADSIVQHVKAINDFSNSLHAWPAGTNIPGAIPTPLMVLLAGDMTTHGQMQDLGAFRLLWEARTMPGSIQFPTFPGLGNHDVYTNNDSEGAHRMYDYVANSACGVSMDPGSHNYSFDLNSVHFVNLNSWAGVACGYYPSPFPATGLTWLTNDLAAKVGKSGRPVVIYQHYPMESATGTDTETMSTCNWNASTYQTFQQIIQNYNVVAFFAGHTHALAVENPDLAGLTGANVSHAVDQLGRPRILDGFVDGSGGESGVGDFMTVNLTDHYLDVGAFTWNGVGSAALPSTSFTSGADGTPLWFAGGQSACRKSINDQLIPAPAAVQVSPSTGTVQNALNWSQQVTVTNRGTTTIPGPIAVKVQGVPARSPENPVTCGSSCPAVNVSNRSFMDSCTRNGSFYVLLPNVTSLAPNQSASVTLQFSEAAPADAGHTTLPPAPPTSYNISAVVVAPQHGSQPLTAPVGADPGTIQRVTPVPNVQGVPLQVPQDEQVMIYGPANAPFSATVTPLNGPPGWLFVKNTGAPFAFDAFGRATITLSYNGSLLKPVVGGVASASVTVDNAVNQTLFLVSLTFKAQVTMTLVSSPATSAPPGAKVTFTTVLSGQINDPNESEPTAIQFSGIVSLREQFLDSAGNVASTTTLSVANVNDQNANGECLSGLSWHDNTVVFGDTGGNMNFCPSRQASGQGVYTFSLPPGLHRLAAYYEGSGLGDSTYAPAVSPTVLFRVGTVPAHITVFSGSPQTTGVGLPFDLPLVAKVTDAQGGPVAGYAVHFAGPASGAGLLFNGSTVFDAVTDSTGAATTPLPSANSTTGSFQATAGISVVNGDEAFGQSALFSLTSVPLSGTPAITATIVNKVSLLGTPLREWTVQMKNAGAPAYAVRLNSIAFTPETSPACTPIVTTGMPILSASLTNASAFDQDVLLIDFSSCLVGARFTVTLSFSANNGLYTGQTVIGHQFQ